MKVGDKVIYLNGQMGTHLPKVKIIERETKLYFIVDKQKFSKTTLWVPGDGWYKDCIKEFNEDVFRKMYDAVFPRVALNNLSYMSWKDYSDEFLCKIFKLCIEESKKLNKGE